MSKAAAARVLGSLLAMPEAALESFAATVLSKDSSLTPQEIQAVRDIIERLGDAMLADEYEPARWARIQEIHDRLLEPLSKAEPAAEPKAAAPAPPAPPPLESKTPRQAEPAAEAPAAESAGANDEPAAAFPKAAAPAAREMPPAAAAPSSAAPSSAASSSAASSSAASSSAASSAGGRPRFSVPSKRSAPPSPWARAPLDDEDKTALAPMPTAALRGKELPSGWMHAEAKQDGLPPATGSPAKGSPGQGAPSKGKGLPKAWSQPPPADPAAPPLAKLEPEPAPRWNPYEHPIDETVDAPPPARDEPAERDESDDPLMRTVTSFVKRDAIEAMALPFREGAPRAEGQPRQESAPRPETSQTAEADKPKVDGDERRDAPAEKRDPLAQTMTSLAVLDKGAALPFDALLEPQSQPPAPPRCKRPSQPPPRSDRGFESAPPASAPQSNTVDEAAAHPALAQYAALCASCRVHPVRRSTLNAQYGLYDDSARRQLDTRWRDHFATHPDEYAIFKRLVAEYQDWLIRQPQ